MMTFSVVSIAIYDRVDASNDEDPDRKVLDLYPLCVVLVMLLTRIMIISIRHGTSSVGNFLKNRSDNIS